SGRRALTDLSARLAPGLRRAHGLDELDRLFLRRLRLAAVTAHPEADLRQPGDRLAERLLPAHADLDQVRIAGREPPLAGDLELVHAIGEQVDRRAHGDVRAHRRVEREQRVLRGLLERRPVEANAPIEDRPAVLGLADLQIGRVLAGL